jgi:MFS family permease
MPDPPRPSSRNVFVFGLTSFLNDTASEMSYWILPAFLTSLGAGPAQLGLIEGIAESVAASTKLFSGYLTDRLRRRKPLIIAGYAIANLSKPLLGVTVDWWQVLFVRFADRTAKGLRGAPRDVMLAESVDRKRLGSAFGLMQAMDTAGAIAGPSLALLLLYGAGVSVRNVFWFAAIPGLLSVLVVSVFARETGRRRDGRAPVSAIGPPPSPPHAEDGSGLIASVSVPAPTAAALFPRRFYFLMLTVGTFSLGASSDMFLILRAQQVGVAVEYAPLLGLVFNVVYSLTSWPAGRLSDKMPKAVVAAAGYLVYAVTYFAFAQAGSTRTIWVMMGFYGLFYSLTNPVLRALVAETIAPEARGRALGIYHFLTSVTLLLSSLVTGYLWERFGAALPLHLSAILALVAAAMMLLLRRPGASPRRG